MICGNCKTDKEETCFSFKDKSTGKRQSYCKDCHRVHSNTYYARNKEACGRRTFARNKVIELQNKENVLSILKDKSCVDCGESDPVVLEFDHIDRATKRDSVSNMVHRGMSFKTILIEIEKCEIRCANCHRRKTAKEANYYRYIAG